MSLHRQWEGFLVATVPDWQQVLPIGTEVKALALAEDGDLYLAGNFEDTLRLGAATLVSAGETDVFIARFDKATGTFSWAQRAGGPGYDVVNAMAVRAGQVYLAGYVGAIEPRRATVADFGALKLPAQGITDLYVAKLDTDAGQAHFGWVQGLPGVRNSEGQRLAVRGTTVYLVGSLEAHNGYFGITSNQAGASQKPDTTQYHQSHFLARLTDAGARCEMTAMLMMGFDRPTFITALVAGRYPNVYLAGNYEADPLTFVRTPQDQPGTGQPGTGQPTHPEARLEKYTDDGRHLLPQWRYTLGDSSETTVNALVVKDDRLYAAGAFRKQAHFQDIKLTTPAQAGFLACLTDDDTAPHPVWAVPLTSRANRASRYQARALALHDSALYVAGSYEALQPDGTNYFDKNPTLEQQFERLADYHNPGIFVSQVIDHGATGQPHWQQLTTGDGMSFVAALAATAGPVYVVGHFVPRVQFGRFWLSFGNTPKKRLLEGFWAELGPTKSKDAYPVEVNY
jgi:hypothetical protein